MEEKKCPRCKADVYENTDTCPICGCRYETAKEQTAVSPAERDWNYAPSVFENDLMKRLVGEKYDSYLQAFRKAFSFNLSAFLFGSVWYAYRRMFLGCIIIIVLDILAVIAAAGLNLLIAGLEMPDFSQGISISSHDYALPVCLLVALIYKAIVGLSANGIYKISLEKRFVKANSLNPAEKEHYLRSASGTSITGVVALPLLAIFAFSAFYLF
ncbi:MAG: DUF2628 domain-containing protein, partial [Abditibacteriota bacterium]|nr:DUF2628 domain-containing protein [Abditibacteriota bacterium]